MDELIRGYWRDDKHIPIMEIEGNLYALYGWNGKCFVKCWRVDPKDMGRAINMNCYTIEPLFDIKDAVYGYWIPQCSSANEEAAVKQMVNK